MADENNLEIGIKVNADTRGEKQAVDSVKEVTNAAKQSGEKAGESAREAAKGFRETGKSAHEASELVRGIGEASQGGVGGILAMAGAARAFFGLLRGAAAGNPLGWILIALGTIVGLWQAVTSKTKESGDAAKQTSVDFETAAEAAKKLGDVQLENLTKKLDALKQGAASFLATLAQADALLDKRDSAQAAAKIATIDANPNLAPVDKVIAKAKVEADLTANKRAREDAALQNDSAVKGDVLVKLDDDFQKAKKERLDQEKKVAALVAKQNTRKLEIGDLENEQAAFKAGHHELDSAGDAKGAAEIDARKKRQEEIKARLENLRGEEEIAQSPKYQEAFKIQADRLAKAKAAEDKTEAAAKAAAAEFQQADVTQQLAKKVNPEIRRAEDDEFSRKTNQAFRDASGETKLKADLKKGLEEQADLKKAADADRGFTIGGSPAEKALNEKIAANSNLRSQLGGISDPDPLLKSKLGNRYVSKDLDPNLESPEGDTRGVAAQSKDDKEFFKQLFAQLPGQIGAAVKSAVSGGTIEKGGEKFTSKDGNLKKVADSSAAVADAASSLGDEIVRSNNDTEKAFKKTEQQLKDSRDGS